MVFEEKEFTLKGKTVILRSAKVEEAQMLIDYLKTVCGETRFLLVDPDEVQYTREMEEEFIKSKNESDNSMLVLAFVDGEYAGNCSFQPCGNGRRYTHRTDIGIALFQKYTGFGLGRLMLTELLKKIEEHGFEQAELAVVATNERALKLYKSLGFEEYGRVPHANKYQDGTYTDDFHMIKTFKAQ